MSQLDPQRVSSRTFSGVIEKEALSFTEVAKQVRKAPEVTDGCSISLMGSLSENIVKNRAWIQLYLRGCYS